MQIKLFGDTSLVTSACAEETHTGLRVIISAKSRDMGIRYQGGCWRLSGADAKAKHRAFLVWNEEDSYRECEVVFLAESPREAALLHGIIYDNRCKEQMMAIFLREALDGPAVTLGEWPARGDL